jgi:hypothetical protein
MSLSIGRPKAKKHSEESFDSVWVRWFAGAIYGCLLAVS